MTRPSEQPAPFLSDMSSPEELLKQLLAGNLSASRLVIDDLDMRKKANQNVGWLYILRNPAFRKKLLKIGKTSRYPTERAQELGRRTGLPDGFQLLHYIHVSDHHLAEQYVHQLLAQKRYRPDREFFDVSLQRAVDVFDQVAEAFPLIVGSGRSKQVMPQDYGQKEPITCRQCSSVNHIRNLPVTLRHRCASCKAILYGAG